MAVPQSELPAGLDGLNINISAYRVLYILLLLVQYRSLNAGELNRFLFENALIQRHYNTETLTKYVNTLREVGCDIPRASNRNDYCYELRRNPFPFELSHEEWDLLGRLETVLDQQDDELLAGDFRALLQQIRWSASGEPRETGAPENLPMAPAGRKRLNLYRRYCREGFTLEVHARGGTRRLEPQEVRLQGSRLFLLGIDPSSLEVVSLDVDQIESVRQLPSKNRHPVAQTPVTFALYGRLARNYRLYPDEKIVYQRDGELHIKTKTAEPSLLLSRLMKYGDLCRVLSPESCRQQMRTRIDAKLAALQES